MANGEKKGIFSIFRRNNKRTAEEEQAEMERSALALIETLVDDYEHARKRIQRSMVSYSDEVEADGDLPEASYERTLTSRGRIPAGLDRKTIENLANVYGRAHKTDELGIDVGIDTSQMNLGKKARAEIGRQTEENKKAVDKTAEYAIENIVEPADALTKENMRQYIADNGYEAAVQYAAEKCKALIEGLAGWENDLKVGINAETGFGVLKRRRKLLSEIVNDLKRPDNSPVAPGQESYSGDVDDILEMTAKEKPTGNVDEIRSMVDSYNHAISLEKALESAGKTVELNAAGMQGSEYDRGGALDYTALGKFFAFRANTVKPKELKK